MACAIAFTDDGKQSLHELHIGIQRMIKTALQDLADDVATGTPLMGQLLGFFTYRVKKYRVIYTRHVDKIIVHYVGHRSRVYDEALAALRAQNLLRFAGSVSEESADRMKRHIKERRAEFDQERAHRRKLFSRK